MKAKPGPYKELYGPSITVSWLTTPGSIWLSAESMSSRVFTSVIPLALVLSWPEL